MILNLIQHIRGSENVVAEALSRALWMMLNVSFNFIYFFTFLSCPLCCLWSLTTWEVMGFIFFSLIVLFVHLQGFLTDNRPLF